MSSNPTKSSAGFPNFNTAEIEILYVPRWGWFVKERLIMYRQILMNYWKPISVTYIFQTQRLSCFMIYLVIFCFLIVLTFSELEQFEVFQHAFEFPSFSHVTFIALIFTFSDKPVEKKGCTGVLWPISSKLAGVPTQCLTLYTLQRMFIQKTHFPLESTIFVQKRLKLQTRLRTLQCLCQ